MNKYKTGMDGQQAAEAFLLDRGMRILARNWRVKTGEIDLVARDGEYIVFVEVKYRSSTAFGYPREAVNAAKQKRIMRTALNYIARYRLVECALRFDVVEVIADKRQLHISHIENAFGL